MNGRVMVAVAMLATLGGPALAQGETPAAPEVEQVAGQLPTAAEAEAPPQEERKICRTEKATGSLTRRNRICLTQAQWREIYDRTRRGVGELQGSASGGKVCHPDPADPFQGCPG